MDETTQTDSMLTITLDAPAVELILEGLEQLSLGRVQHLYNALKDAADKQWNAEDAT